MKSIFLDYSMPTIRIACKETMQLSGYSDEHIRDGIPPVTLNRWRQAERQAERPKLIELAKSGKPIRSQSLQMNTRSRRILFNLSIIIFCWVMALPAGVIGAQSQTTGKSNANKQHEITLIRAKIQQYNDELLWNRSAQQRTDISEDQRMELKKREVDLSKEIARLQVREQALQ